MAKQSLKNWPDRLKSPSYWWATFGGVGMIPVAPGTWGSLFGAFAGYGLLLLGFDWVMLTLGAGIITVISIAAINKIETATGIHDSGEIVIDEVAGQWLAMLPLAGLMTPIPCGDAYLTAENIAYSFALFRLFDILKPWPINWLDRHVSGGFGVMVDDLLAGLMAASVLYFIV